MSTHPWRRSSKVFVGIAAIAVALTPVALHLRRPPATTEVVVLDRQPDPGMESSAQWIEWLLEYGKYQPHRIVEALEVGRPAPDVLYINGLSDSSATDQGVSLTVEELNRIQEWAMSGTRIIAEIDTFSAPIDYYIAEDFRRLFGVTDTGWTGKRVEDLDSPGEVPEAIRTAYEVDHGTPWSYEGAGVLLAHRDGSVVVLPEKTHLTTGGVRLRPTSTGRDRLGLAEDSYFAEWFIVEEPRPETDVLAEFSMELTAQGRRVLDEAGIPDRFPAILEYTTPYHSAVLFAGDFSLFHKQPGIAAYEGFPRFRRIFSIPAPNARDHAFWTVYIPALQKLLARAGGGQAGGDGAAEAIETAGTTVEREFPIPARLSENRFLVPQGDGWDELYIHGVNLGDAIPGRFFTDFPQSDLQYIEWFRQIADMNINTIRIYTLQAPAFYRAFAAYNAAHPETPLYLLHEIWPEEHPPNNDLLDPAYMDAFDREIRYVVDAVNGAGSVPPRSGRASGTYRHDISRWVIGYLVGREIEPVEVVDTNDRHPDFAYTGEYISSTTGNAAEAWLARASDVTAVYEADTYGRARPISIVSWPPLDALSHPVEWAGLPVGTTPQNDTAVVDINRIDVSDAFVPGFFGSYHIYPNYPDFIINSSAYGEYTDGEGPLWFGGYLQEFMAYHTRYPALVAEFGAATGQGVAHFSPDGLHHGGMSEAEQGQAVIRMFEAIRREGYLGGVVFEWMDEWVKKTWTTEPFIIPYERNVYWHNAVDPEQNYGLLAYEAVFPSLEPVPGMATGAVPVDYGFDASFLHLRVQTGRPLQSKEELLLGFDTYDPGRGSLTYQEGLATRAPSGIEFLLRVGDGVGGDETAELIAVTGYALGEVGYASPEVSDTFPGFRPIRVLVNRSVPLPGDNAIPARYWDAGRLRHGTADDRGTQWYYRDGAYHFRIPWTLLHVTDPSTFRVLHDEDGPQGYPAGQDVLDAVPSDGLLFSLRLLREGSVVEAVDALRRVRPAPWSIPTYRSRLKDSYHVLRAYLSDANGVPEEDDGRKEATRSRGVDH